MPDIADFSRKALPPLEWIGWRKEGKWGEVGEERKGNWVWHIKRKISFK